MDQAKKQARQNRNKPTPSDVILQATGGGIGGSSSVGGGTVGSGGGGGGGGVSPVGGDVIKFDLTPTPSVITPSSRLSSAGARTSYAGSVDDLGKETKA